MFPGLQELQNVSFPQNPVCLIFLYPDSSNLLSCTHDSLQTHSISRSADGPVSEDPYRVNASGKIPHFYPLSWSMQRILYHLILHSVCYLQ